MTSLRHLLFDSAIAAPRPGRRFPWPGFLAGLLAVALLGGARAADTAAPASTRAATPPLASASRPAASVPTAASSIAATAPFDTFRIVTDRNIFDPNRYSRSARNTAAAPQQPTGDTIGFVGTMQYDKGYFAFFDSPDARYRKVLPEGGKIADFVVQRVAPSGVDLVRDGKVISLQITQQLHRPDGGDWAVNGAELAPAASTAAPASAADNGTPPIPADASDILKRLMEQRQKPLKE